MWQICKIIRNSAYTFSQHHTAERIWTSKTILCDSLVKHTLNRQVICTKQLTGNSVVSFNDSAITGYVQWWCIASSYAFYQTFQCWEEMGMNPQILYLKNEWIFYSWFTWLRLKINTLIHLTIKIPKLVLNMVFCVLAEFNNRISISSGTKGLLKFYSGWKVFQLMFYHPWYINDFIPESLELLLCVAI